MNKRNTVYSIQYTASPRNVMYHPIKIIIRFIFKNTGTHSLTHVQNTRASGRHTEKETYIRILCLRPVFRIQAHELLTLNVILYFSLSV